MSKVQMLRGFINQRLTAAAEEIFGLFERTISEYEEELCRSKEENQRHRKLLDAVFQPEVRLHRADVQQLLVSKEEVLPEQQQHWSPSLDQEDPPELPHIKEEQEELWTSQEGEQLPGLEEADITKFPNVQQLLVSKEEVPPEQQQWSPRLDQEDPPEPPLFTETDGEDSGGPEPARNFNSDSNLQPVIHDKTSLSSERENNECCDWEENWEEPLQKHKGTQTLVSCSVLFSKEEVPPEQQQQWSPRLDQEDPPEPPHIKEEQEELWSSQEGEQLPGLEEADITKFPFTPVPVKSEENYEEKPQSSQLHQNQTEENRGAEHLKTETDGEDCGAQEPARNFNPDSLLQPATHETKDISDWEENLEEHLPKRNGIQTVLKAFSCSVCKKTFQWRADAVRHMRVHTGEKPFSCSVCGNRFARKDRLRQHLTVHTGERPFRCNICGKTFTRLYIVKNHECVGKRIRNK